MKVGLAMFAIAEAISPAELGKEAETRGFESLFFPEHTHIPTSRLTPFPGGGDLPDYYRRSFDPFVALSAVAATTKTLRVGTGICLVAQRDAIVTAKEVATIDHMSDGRFIFGVGYGWNIDEMNHHGVDYTHRRDTVRNKILAMKELWTKEEASFQSTHTAFSSSWAWPKPATKPHPPILLAAQAGPRTFAHIAEFANGWLPIRGRGDAPLQALPALREAAEKAGRNPDEISITMFGAVAKDIDDLRAAGVERAVLWVPPNGRDNALAALDTHQEFLSQAREGV